MKRIIIMFILLGIWSVSAQNTLILKRSLDDYLLKKGFPERTKKAFSYLKEGVKADDPERIYYYAIMLTGICYKKHNGGKCKYCKHDEKKATDYFKIAAEKNHSGAQLQYALHLAFGRGVHQDKGLAKIYFSKSSAQRNFEAMSYEAECYLIGFGCDTDSLKAYECYKRMYTDVTSEIYKSGSHYKISADSIYRISENYLKINRLDTAIDSIRAIAYPIDYYLMGGIQYKSLNFAP